MKFALICSDAGSGGLLKYIRGFLDTPTEHEVTLYCGKNLAIGESEHVRVVRTELVNESGMDLLLNRPLRPAFVAMVDALRPDAVLFMNGFMRRGLEHYPCLSILHNQLLVDWRLLLCQRPLRLVASLLAVRKALLYTFKHANGNIFLSEASKAGTDAAGYRYQNGRVILFGHDPAGERVGTPEPREMIYVSTAFPYKNHARLLRALARVKQEEPAFHVSLVGCPATPKLEALAKKLGVADRVTFCGWMSHEEALAAIGRASFYLHPSQIESTSNGVLEGLIPGNTVVCSNIGVFSEALGERAYYFSPNSEEEMASAILAALRTPRPLTAEDCRAICEKYDYRQGVEAVYRYAAELCGEG